MLNKFNFWGIVTIGVFVITLYSCSDDSIYKQSFPINEKAWNYHDTLSFNLDIQQNKQAYNLIINLEHKDTYKYKNIFFFVDIIGPTKTYRDTIECIMANTKGRWLASNNGDKFTHHFMYRHNTVFPEKGHYTIVLEQAMRDTSLQAITAIGLELIKYQAKKP